MAAIGFTLDTEHARPTVDKVLSLIGAGERNSPVAGGESPLVMAMRPASEKPVIFAPANAAPDLDVMADSRSLQTTSVGAFGVEFLENRVVSVFRTGDGGQGFGGPGQFQSFSQGNQPAWRPASFSGPSGGGGLSFGGGGGGVPSRAAGTFASEVNGDWLLFAVNHRALDIDPNLLAQNIFNSLSGLNGTGGQAFFGPGGINTGAPGGVGSGLTASQDPGVVPILAALPLFGTALAAFGAFGWRNRRRAAKAACETTGAQPA
ncbi:MAG: hypothetical protein O3A88_01420 [Proteobacteria bacterium]|nr:hypothetical protein [Pseudomonadota bacterium]